MEHSSEDNSRLNVVDDGIRRIAIEEFRWRKFPRDFLSNEEGARLSREYAGKVRVEFPSYGNEYSWRLVSLGWIGTIPLSPDLLIRLVPKTPIGNLFRMLEYAHDLKSFEFRKGFVESDSLEDIYSRLAYLLACAILTRSRKGLHAGYIEHVDRLIALRGSLDLKRALSSPGTIALPCRFEEQTVDIEDNGILAWTLRTILQHGICRQEHLGMIRNAFHVMRGSVSMREYSALNCAGRQYNRLNEDYRPLHALCRFFLERSGPTHLVGDREAVPFLVNMAGLYEMFVARWLEAHLPEAFRLSTQEVFRTGGVSSYIDLVIRDVATGEALCVLDTKYKVKSKIESSDLHQIVSYAVAVKSHKGVLIYPVDVSDGFNQRHGAGDIQVRTIAFSINGNLQEAGEKFRRELLAWCGIA